jgi:hypothetical protein
MTRTKNVIHAKTMTAQLTALGNLYQESLKEESLNYNVEQKGKTITLK